MKDFRQMTIGELCRHLIGLMDVERKAREEGVLVNTSAEARAVFAEINRKKEAANA